GHDLFNLRARYQMGEHWQLAIRLMNLTDKTYSSLTSNQVGSTDIDYRPGMPRSVFASATWQF
ncbi:MAG: TonB-dependent receptor, partial [Alkalimonas sp.]|nr:TonB-dependent receptor [Alkalimonas sp.]